VTSLRASLGVGAVAAVVQAAIVIPFLGRYGWDRDELYFLSAARRPTWGYVDFPPMTAWIGWLVHAAAGDSLVALRATSLVATMVTTVLVTLMARELGASVRVQAAAAFVWVLSPYGLAGGSIFHPTWFDSLCWVALLYTILVAIRRERPRLWLVAGVVAGVGLETKYTIAFLLGALLVALAATRDGRRRLLTPWPWLGLGLAVLLVIPNVVWEAQHGWPSVHFFASQDSKTASDTPPGTYLADQLFLAAGLAVAVIGVVSLWRTPKLRSLALVPPLVTVFFLVERGRAYYPLPADSIAVAAGTIALAGWLRAGGRRRWAVLVPLALLEAAVLVVALPVVLPVRSTAAMISSGVWKNSFYKDEIGWPELASQTAGAWRSLPAAERARAAIVAENYGEASALEHYGPARGLPQVLSGHLSWQYWRPRDLPQRYVLFVGFSSDRLANLCSTARVLATIDNSWHLDNEERGRTVVFCRLRRPLGELWHADIASTTL
jgi:4-amino-4-deoxy-L-arabinose transferase-like glycosyltransferase